MHPHAFRSRTPTTWQQGCTPVELTSLVGLVPRATYLAIGPLVDILVTIVRGKEIEWEVETRVCHFTDCGGQREGNVEIWRGRMKESVVVYVERQRCGYRT